MKKGKTTTKKTKGATKKIVKAKPVTPITPEIEIDPDVDVQKLEAQYARLVETKGFVEAFWEFGCEYTKQEDSYEAVERQYKFIFGKRKYANFESFRGCMLSLIHI